MAIYDLLSTIILFISSHLLQMHPFIIFYLLMDSSDILNEIQKIQKEGSCDKQSRVLKSWRTRWIVLTPNLLLTYKEKRVYKSPTEVIQLRDVVSIKTCEEQMQKSNVFKVDTNDTTFYFSCESSGEKEQWISSIGKAMVQRNNKPRDD